MRRARVRARPVRLCSVGTCLFWVTPKSATPLSTPSSFGLSHYSDICARHVLAGSNLLRRH